MGGNAASYRELYYEWERDQWQAGSIDFAGDASRWSELTPAVRGLLKRGIACSRAAAELSTRLLVPLVDAAPTEEQQVFLTTQLVDAARHVVLFELIDEVVLSAHSEPGEDEAAIPSGYRALLQDEIPALMRAVEKDPSDASLFAEALALSNVHLGQRELLPVERLLQRLAVRERLPGMARGLGAVVRDRERHGRFARIFLSANGRREPVRAP